MRSTSFRAGFICGAAFVGLALAIFVIAHAQSWIVSSGIAHHFDGNNHCRNTFTPGLGLEYGNTVIGFYENSQCRRSWYLGQAWTPLRYGAFRAGVIGGLITGYSAPVLPIAALTASLEGEKYGVNLVLVPPSAESGRGVAWLQLKRRF